MRYFQGWKSMCYCGHHFEFHLTQIDKPENNCTECKCKDYHENKQARWFKLNWEGIVISICGGIIMAGLTWSLLQ